MKKVLIALLALAAFSCNQPNEKMDGAYNMLAQNIKGDTTDTTSKDPQLKIYAGDFMMFTHLNPKDSIVSFGIATFTPEEGGLVEKVIYSASDTTASTTPDSFKLEIEKTPDGFKQVIRDMEAQGQKFTLTEEYKSVTEPKTSPLDGAWENTKMYNITGTDTVKMEAVQYKVFYGGNFMFGHTWMDSTKKIHTGMGFGTFEMSGDNKSKETMNASNYREIAGKSFDIDVTFKGMDEYTQTITDTDGTKHIETYKRMKK